MMPGRDGTGPMGTGPMSGRGMGHCGPYERQVHAWAGRRRLWGRGMGPGFGRGRWCGFGPPALTKAEEEELLQQRKQWLAAEMRQIEQRLQEMPDESDDA